MSVRYIADAGLSALSAQLCLTASSPVRTDSRRLSYRTVTESCVKPASAMVSVLSVTASLQAHWFIFLVMEVQFNKEVCSSHVK